MKSADRVRIAALVVLVAGGMLLGTYLLVNRGSKAHAQDEATPAVREWNALSERKVEIATEIQKIRQEFEAAGRDEQQQLQNRFAELVDEFEEQVHPRMIALAPAILKQQPDNAEAAEMVVDGAMRKNNFKLAAEVGDKLLEAGHDSPNIVNMTGVAHFAIHNFEKAERILKSAQESGQFNQLGARYLADAGDYIEFWKKEQQIRAHEAAAEGDEQLPRIELETNRGKVIVELFENEAPNTVANFVSLVEGKKYDGTKFHRVIPNFMIQGGDPNSLDGDPSTDGTGGPGYVIDCECYREDARLHFRGSLSMAHAGKDTGGSQFFITHLPTSHLNPNPQRQSGHTVFGRVIEGMQVVDAIEAGDHIESATVLRKRNHEYKPQTKPDPRR